MNPICLFFIILSLLPGYSRRSILKPGEELIVLEGFEDSLFRVAAAKEWTEGEGSKSVKIVSTRVSEDLKKRLIISGLLSNLPVI